MRERVRKDPFSRSFISLADELNRAGMRSEAIQVLQDGLEKQPDYMSARVALGKLYVEENDLKGALSEFRLVADAIPDNLFAQRKLADIYMLLGDGEGARAALEMVVRLNPMDSLAKETLEKLSGVSCEAAVSVREAGLPDVSRPAPVLIEAGDAEETEVVQEGVDNIRRDDWIEVSDSLIEGGDYGRAFVHLRRRLEGHPGQADVRQRLEELKTLVKLLGLEDNVRVSLLEAFLESAQREKERSLNG